MEGIANLQSQEKDVVIAKDGRIMNPRSLANMPPKGVSGNPGGMPVNSPQITRTVIRLLSMPIQAEFIPETKADGVALRWYVAAMGGDMRALGMLLDRSEGPVTHSLSIGPPDAGPEELEAMLAEAGLMLVQVEDGANSRTLLDAGT